MNKGFKSYDQNNKILKNQKLPSLLAHPVLKTQKSYFSAKNYKICFRFLCERALILDWGPYVKWLCTSAPLPCKFLEKCTPHFMYMVPPKNLIFQQKFYFQFFGLKLCRNQDLKASNSFDIVWKNSENLCTSWSHWDFNCGKV